MIVPDKEKGTNNVDRYYLTRVDSLGPGKVEA